MTPPSSELLHHHIQDTRDKFVEIKDDLENISNKVGELNDFKISLIVSSRTTSLIVSAICGFLTLVITTIISIKFK